MNSNQKNAYVTKVRQAATDMIDAIDSLREAQVEQIALDLGSVIQDSDLTGDNDGIAIADIWSIVTGTTNFILTEPSGLYASGHNTNLYKIKT